MKSKRDPRPTARQLDHMVWHACYEALALEMACRFLNAANGPGRIFDLEGCLLHVRNLREFLWSDWNPESDHAPRDLFAVHYGKRWATERPKIPAKLADTRAAINGQLSHLSRDRLNANARRDLVAAAPALGALVLRAWSQFRGTLGTKWRARFDEEDGKVRRHYQVT